MEGRSEQVADKGSKDRAKAQSVKQEDKDFEGTFRCYSCGLEEHFHYKGKHSPFTTSIEFVEACYIMKDPFSPKRPAATNRKQKEVNEPFLILGSDCYSCKRPVCRDTECSVFYKHHFCLPCALKSVDIFPAPIQKRLKCIKGQR